MSVTTLPPVGMDSFDDNENGGGLPSRRRRWADSRATSDREAVCNGRGYVRRRRGWHQEI